MSMTNDCFINKYTENTLGVCLMCTGSIRLRTIIICKQSTFWFAFIDCCSKTLANSLSWFYKVTINQNQYGFAEW